MIEQRQFRARPTWARSRPARCASAR